MLVCGSETVPERGIGNSGQWWAVVMVGSKEVIGGRWRHVAAAPEPVLPLFPVHHSRGQPRCQVFSVRRHCQGQVVVVAVSDVDATS